MLELFCLSFIVMIGLIAFYELLNRLRKHSKTFSDEQLILTIFFAVFTLYLTWIFVKVVILLLK